jgi:hypothetical protein
VMAENGLDIWVEGKNSYIYQESTQISAVVQPVGQSRTLLHFDSEKTFVECYHSEKLGPFFI